jgi:hypothetical protein
VIARSVNRVLTRDIRQPVQMPAVTAEAMADMADEGVLTSVGRVACREPDAILSRFVTAVP